MDSENLNSADNAPELPLAGPGGTLRAAREALRLDLAHVAAETRIPLRHLEAIETDNFESLPSRAYAIGFSRTFAKVVGLDPAAITDAVRAELADGSMRRAMPSSDMEPGDPARLPSAGLAWVSAAAVLVFVIGVFAFYNSYFGAGTVPGSLLSPEPAASTAPAAAMPAATRASAASQPVVLTALEDGVWLRLYEEGGERLVERTLKQGEAVTVPLTAADPRLNTGRPDALAVTIGGQMVAKISDRPQTISGMPVSPSALFARASVPVVDATAATPAVTATMPSLNRPAERRTAPAQLSEAERSSQGAYVPASPGPNSASSGESAAASQR